MKVLRMLFLCILVSCNGGGGGGSSGASLVKVSTTISDSTITRFEQTSGVAKADSSIFDFIIARAYAAVGNISCYSGQTVTIDMDILISGTTTNLVFDMQCGASVELKIRQKMLDVLTGHFMIREKGNPGTGPDYALDFVTDPFAFDYPFTILEKKGWASVIPNQNANWCFMDYVFNYETGTVSNSTKTTFVAGRALAHNTASNDNYSISNPNMPTFDNTYEGCPTMSTNYSVSHFRFKNGKLEMDESGTKAFSPNGCALFVNNVVTDYNENGDGNGGCPDSGYDSTYERFCFDDDANGSCDNI